MVTHHAHIANRQDVITRYYIFVCSVCVCCMFASLACRSLSLYQWSARISVYACVCVLCTMQVFGCCDGGTYTGNYHLLWPIVRTQIALIMYANAVCVIHIAHITYRIAYNHPSIRMPALLAVIFVRLFCGLCWSLKKRAELHEIWLPKSFYSVRAAFAFVYVETCCRIK